MKTKLDRLALYQMTGKGAVFSLDEIKKMSKKELADNLEYYSDLKLRFRRPIT